MASGQEWDVAEIERAQVLARGIRERMGATKMWAIRAPGRGNLIGEHTDYSGLPVLPIAIDRSTIAVGAATEGDEIEILNADPAYGSRRFRLARHIEPYPSGDWGNYIKAAVQGTIDHFAARGLDIDRLGGGVMAVDGRVPISAGLSSSAALTVAATLAFMAINRLELPPLQTAEMVARSEWYVGTMAGGMDQAASLMGRRDHALFIEFNPLRVRPVPMPSGAAVVAADSREPADKSGKVRSEYNRRVVECALAARILARALRLDGVKILGDIVRALDNWDADKLIETLGASAPASLVNIQQAAQILGTSEQTLRTELFGNRIALDPPSPLEIFRRARHVLSETRRVQRAVAALNSGTLEEMGALMNASHQSLRDDFEVSTPRLDELVECARRGGAFGARLTGAGFGGSIIALCRRDKAPAVIAEIDRGYYAGRPISDGEREQSRAILRAGPGASVIELTRA
jgi:N-acetylgalactosamine kinase